MGNRARFEGKVALVTGAAAGLGRASALGFAREGARVVIVDVDAAGGEETLQQIQEAGAEGRFFQTDVADGTSVERLVAETLQAFGRLDVAHNNAGILGDCTNVVACDDAAWDRTIAVNLTSVRNCLRYEIPAMVNGGAIVNTSSIGGMFAAQNSAAYMAAKHGVIGLTKSAAIDFGPAGVRVNALLPGAIRTAMLGPAARAAELPLAAMTQRIPLRRISEPGEQADAVLWLASDEASFVTGIALIVDGGITMQV